MKPQLYMKCTFSAMQVYTSLQDDTWTMAKLSIRCLYKICLTSRWIIVSPFPPRFLNRDASFFDLCPTQDVTICGFCLSLAAVPLLQYFPKHASCKTKLARSRSPIILAKVIRLTRASFGVQKSIQVRYA